MTHQPPYGATIYNPLFAMTQPNDTDRLKMEAKLAELEADAQRFERGERTSRAPVVLTINSPADVLGVARRIMGGAR